MNHYAVTSFLYKMHTHTSPSQLLIIALNHCVLSADFMLAGRVLQSILPLNNREQYLYVNALSLDFAEDSLFSFLAFLFSCKML